MKKFSRIFLFCALMLILLTACAGQQGSPTVVGTLPGVETATPPAVATETAGTETTATEAATAATTETPTGALDLTGTAATNTTETAATNTTLTPGVPVTGGNILLLECQFCIDNVANALLVIPSTATFELTSQTA